MVVELLEAAGRSSKATTSQQLQMQFVGGLLLQPAVVWVDGASSISTVATYAMIPVWGL
jgi:hypothetical protein